MNLHSLSQWSYLFAWKQILLPSFNCILKEKVKIMFVLNLLISWQTSRSSTLKQNIFLNTVWAIVALSREGFFSYHTCCDTGSWFLWSHHKDPLIYLLSFYNMQGEQSTYSNLSPQGIPCTMTPLLDMYDCPLWELWVSDIYSGLITCFVHSLSDEPFILNLSYLSRWAQIIFWSWSRSNCWSQF